MRRLSLLAFGTACLGIAAAQAREPGIAPLFPPGLTLGVPIAATAPPGFYLTSRSARYDGQVINHLGQYAGRRITALSEALQLTWIPDWRPLGATLRIFVAQPVVYVEENRTAPVPAAMQGWVSRGGFANTKLQPFELAWSLGDGFFASAGFGFYVPDGDWALNAPINIGANFWTFEPDLGFTYFKDGWNASLHVVYNTNTWNQANHYYSGDQLFLNATVTKNIEGFDFGPVAYWQREVGSDVNAGGRTVFGGTTIQPAEQTALGATLGHPFGRFYAQLMYTQDVYARNALMGGKAWLNLSYRF